jgi:hypothetical protein
MEWSKEWVVSKQVSQAFMGVECGWCLKVIHEPLDGWWSVGGV